MFDEKFANINSSDKSMFQEVINHLLVHSFIVRDIFDNKEKIIKINPYYRFVERHFDLINEYLGNELNFGIGNVISLSDKTIINETDIESCKKEIEMFLEECNI